MPRYIERESFGSSETKKIPEKSVLAVLSRITQKVGEKQAPPSSSDKRNIPEFLKRIFPEHAPGAPPVLPKRKTIAETFKEVQKEVVQPEISSISEKNWFDRIDVTPAQVNDFKKEWNDNKVKPEFEHTSKFVNKMPTDQRTYAVLKQLYEDRGGRSEEEMAALVAGQLAEIVVATGLDSPAANEARYFLDNIQKEFGANDQITALTETIKEYDPPIFYDLNIEDLPTIDNYDDEGETISISDKVARIEYALSNTEHGVDAGWHDEYEIQIKTILENSEKYDLSSDTRVKLREVQKRIQQHKQSLEKPIEEQTRRVDRDRYSDSEEDEQLGFDRISSFEMTQERIFRFMDNPYEEAETLLRQVREEFEHADQESADRIQKQIGLVQERLTIADVQKDAIVYLKRKNYSETQKMFDVLSQDPNKLDRFIRQREKDMQEVKDILNYRMGVMYASYVIQKTGNPEMAQKSLINTGMKGFHHLLSQEQGMVGVVYQKYLELLNEGRRDSNGKLRRYTAETYKDISQRLYAELTQEKALYDEIYQKKEKANNDGLMEFRSEEERKKREDETKLTDEDIKAIIWLAEDAAVISQRDLVPLLRGRKPLKYEESGRASFVVEKAHEGVLDSMDILRHMERYMRLSPGQKAMLRMSSIMAANSTGIGHQIDSKIEDYMSRQNIHKGSERSVELLQDYFNDNVDSMKAFFTVDMKTGSKRTDNIPQNWNDVSDEDLFYVIKTQYGEQVLSTFAGHSDYFSSGWRINEYVRQLNKMYTGSETSVAKGIGMGMRLRLAGADLLGAESHHDYEHAEEKVVEVWHEIAEFRPHTVLDVMIDAKDPLAKREFNELMSKGILKGMHNTDGTSIENSHQLVQVLGRRYRIINEKLAQRGISPINYSDDAISNEQMAVIKEVTDTLKDTDADSYLQTMKELAHWGHDKGHSLIGLEYRNIYKTTLFLDDAPQISFMDKPEEAPGSKTFGRGDDPTVMNIATIFTAKGMGEKDVLVRSWSDSNIAKELAQQVYLALDPSKKNHMEAIKAIQSIVPNLGGDKQVHRGAMYLSGGYMKLGKVKTVYDWLFLESAKKSAPMKEWFGPHAEVLGLAERHEMASDLALLLRSLPDDVAKESAEWFESYLGLKNPITINGKVVRFTSLPYNLYKSRLAALMLIGIILAPTIQQSMEGLSSSFGGGSAPAGGGHGAAHH